MQPEDRIPAERSGEGLLVPVLMEPVLTIACVVGFEPFVDIRRSGRSKECETAGGAVDEVLRAGIRQVEATMIAAYVALPAKGTQCQTSHTTRKVLLTPWPRGA
jgi:hypothetical protein